MSVSLMISLKASCDYLFETWLLNDINIPHSYAGLGHTLPELVKLLASLTSIDIFCSLYNDFAGECMYPVITVTSVTVEKKTITFVKSIFRVLV